MKEHILICCTLAAASGCGLDGRHGQEIAAMTQALGKGQAPGQNGTAPGLSGQTPGQSGQTPGQGAPPPGQSGSTPGQSGSAPGGGKGGAPPASCLQIQQAHPAAADGIYTIEPVAGSPIQVSCLMSADGGGWTLVGNRPPPVNGDGVAGWTSGDQVGTSFTDASVPFKMSDALINTIQTGGYRAHGTATTCLQGPCDVDTTLFWQPSCVYSSGSLGTACGAAFLDPQFTTPTPYGSDAEACPWHWGLVSSVCGVISTFGTSHVGDHVFVGELTTFVHAFDGRYPENPSVQFWVR